MVLILVMMTLLCLLSSNFFSKNLGTSVLSCGIVMVGVFIQFFSLCGLFFYSQCWKMLGEWFLIDGLSGLMTVMTVMVAGMSIVCSDKDLSLKVGWIKIGFELCIYLIMLICVLSFNVSSWIEFYFFFESSLLPTFWLILGWGYQPERLQAGVFMLMYTVCGSFPLLIVLLWYYLEVGSDCFCVSSLVINLQNFLGSSLVSVSWVLLMMGFFIKLPIYFFHGWLPKAHVEAPLSGSMILAGVLLKLGGYGIIRMMMIFGSTLWFVNMVIVSVAIVGGLLCSMLCLVQSDVKALIAYSSIGHMGMSLGGMMSSLKSGVESGIWMMFSHGLCSPCLFCLAAVSYAVCNSRSVMISKGFLMIFPFLSIFWFVFSSLNMGCPPSVNFLSEVILVSSILSMSKTYMFILGMLSFVGGVYCMNLYTMVNHGLSSLFLISKASIGERHMVVMVLCSLVLCLGVLIFDLVL
uniref:NADH dehydrogenase subunit 4 n=1 Tax=Musculium lacustre TaxID=98299 RepID=UPI002237A722|nr:NADH dehydrogenase subunit 4 [Musculium lacustre]UYR45702.1 NADH dehydrogenase subunit 4 [Musculium lacustre]